MIAVLLLAAAAAAEPAPVAVGKFNASAFPKAVLRERRMPQADLTARADRILESKACSFPGQSVDRYAITVPYAVLLQPSGAVAKVIVHDVGCPDLEILTGQVANELGKAGDFKPTGATGEQWYVSDVFYGHGGQDVARVQKDDDKIICEGARVITGSHLAKGRDCRTVAQWKAYRLERERMQRDLLSDGKNVQFDDSGAPTNGSANLGGFAGPHP